jgi:hypothetical protein
MVAGNGEECFEPDDARRSDAATSALASGAACGTSCADMNAVVSVEGPPITSAPVAARLESLDLLRGLVMVLMALDHTRDFFHNGVYHFDPLDLSRTTPAIFLTRWITHFCAPVFVFLAGTGAFLSTTRGKSKCELSWFLLTRGAWLVFLELTWVKCFGWTFAFDFSSVSLIVIWALGCSMIVLAGLVYLPTWAVSTFGLAMILGHNVLDGVKPEDLGAFGGLWRVLHAGGDIELARGFHAIAGYPLGWRDGGRLRGGPVDDTGFETPPGAGDSRDLIRAPVRNPPPDASLRRTAPVERAGQSALDAAFHTGLPEIPAVALLPADDFGAGAAVPGAV